VSAAPTGGSNELPYLIAESFPHMVWVAGPDGATQYVNRRWQQYTGRSPGRLMGWDWQTAVHPDDVPRALGLWLRTLRSGEPYAAEFRLRGADGDYRWHLDRALALRDGRGHITHWFGICTDIEDHKRAEQAQSRLAAIVEFSEDAITSADNEGRVLTWNPGAERLYGYTEAEMVGRPFSLVVPPELRDEVPRRMAQVARGRPSLRSRRCA
jgi:PAS domain S-box-containing protein